MAPNIRLERPSEEALIAPITIQRDENTHGTHRVVSTYAKKEEPETNLFQNVPITTPTSTPEDQLTSDQEQKKQKRQQIPKPEGKLQHKMGKMLRQPSSSLLREAIDQEDAESDEMSEEQPIRFMTENLKVQSKDADTYGNYPLFLQGRLPNPFVSTRDTNPSFESISSFAVDERNNAQVPNRASNVYKYTVKPQEASPVAFNFEPEDLATTTTTIKTPQHLPSPSSSPLITTYRPPKRPNHRPLHNHNSKENNININHSNNSADNNQENNILPPTSQASNTPSVPSKTQTKNHTSTQTASPQPMSPVIVREIIIESEASPSELIHLQEEFADFSNLFHHQKTLDEFGTDVAVKGDGWLLSSEGSTAAILGCMCSLIMMLICSIFLLKKWRNRALGKGKGGQKEKHIEEKEKHSFQKAPPHADLHIPASLVPHLSFLYQLAHHHSTVKLDATVSTLIDIEEDRAEARLGRLWFSVRFNAEKSDLHVNISHARYPNGREVAGNPGELWVEGVVLSPMNTVKATCKTSTRRATQSPVFNHSFLFLLQEKEVKSDILKLTLHDQHPKKGEQTIGSIIVPLSSIDLHSDEVYCRDLL